MSHAEIIRINVSSDRTVKVMCSFLPSSVLPSAWKRGSSELCLVSGTTPRGALIDSKREQHGVVPSCLGAGRISRCPD
jgi:hypothetical protein